ncbi:PIG-L deacetylase family protein [Ornithinibacillus halophilus]|uniref:GlcNAc-PI de-N-acetylase n=1 Tax=Ornithinibacillus halophilus TaxID=930117 RepID=A0A1M5GRH1_9BACI|nr:PIG-L family deacetylase [Ornithinibacillus halophilus]SHG06326.1 GlcNAc-PI de-N-acetylase [Ornithinibacillus halophilus]
MRKFIFLISTVIVICCTVIIFSLLDTNSTAVHIYYSPHPDDETLSMGASIVEELDNGHDVQIVLLTQGAASSAINKINKDLEANGKDLLSVEDFVDARLAEFQLAVSKLGVPEENIHIFDYPDGGLELQNIKELMKEFEEMYKDAYHHAFSYHDPHPDHRTTGEALLDLEENGQVTHAKYFVPRYVDLEHIGQLTSVNPEYTKVVQEALHAYGRWDTENGYYSVGFYSVPDAFNQMLQDTRNRFHDSNE